MTSYREENSRSKSVVMHKALIVEDIVEMQSWLAKALTTVFAELEIDTAGNVKDALVLVQKNTYQIALVDLGLPDGSGVEVVAALKQAEKNVLTVVVTIFDDNAHIFPALKAGAKGYLLKDQTMEQFVKSLQGISRNEPPLSPAIARKLLSHFADDDDEPTCQLTRRETEVLMLIAKGITLTKAATLLEITRNTAAGYVKEIYRKLDISSRAEAAMEAAKRGLI